MPDAFISYSRHDLDFVRGLVAALEDRGKDVWVDVEDIAPASPWAADLRDAIAGSDAFVFVISPHSVASPQCARELENAVSAGKRIVPVCLQRADDVPAPLQEPNWVPQLGTFVEAYDDSVSLLIEAIETDYAWVRKHTELGLRAAKWDRADRPRHLLLPGEEIGDAENWLDKGHDKKPSPTPLHSEFVRSSRVAQVSRLRRTRTVIAVILVITLGLAGFAWLQRQQAVAEEHIAQSQTLASDATASLASDPELSVMLALKALDIDRTPQAEGVLRLALPLMRTQRTLQVGSPVSVATFSPDGKMAATGSEDGRTVIWDLSTGRVVRELARHPTPVYRAVFSQDGRLLATGSGKTAHVVDVASGAPVIDLDEADDVSALGFAPDGRSLVVAAGASVRREYIEGIPAIAVEYVGHTNTVLDVDVSADGELLATGSFDGTAKIWRMTDGSQLQSIDGGQRLVDSVAFSPDGRRLVTGALADGNAHVWDVASGEEIATLRGHRGLVYSANFSPDGNQIVTAGADGTVRIWDAQTGGERTSLLGHLGSVRTAEFDFSGERVITAGLDGTARLWRVAFPEEQLSLGRRGGPSAVVAAASRDRSLIATGHGDGTVNVWDALNGRLVVGPLRAGSEVRAVAFSPDSGELLASSFDGTASIWDSRSGIQHTLLQGTGPHTYGGAWSPTGEEVATGSANGLIVWTLTGVPRLTIDPEAPQRLVAGVAYDPTGKRLAAALSTDGVGVWSVESGRPVMRVRPGGQLGCVAWSPDGKYLVVCDVNVGVTEVLDADDGKQLAALRGDEGSVRDAAFSADGTQIATAGQDGRVRVWNWRGGQLLATLQGHGDAVFSVEFMPSGTLLSSSGDGTARTWSCDLCVGLGQLYSVARQRVTRDFTDAERERYLKPLGY